MENQTKSLSAFIYFDFQYQSPTQPDFWCSMHGTWFDKGEALSTAAAYEKQTGRRTRLIQIELYRTVL